MGHGTCASIDCVVGLLYILIPPFRVDKRFYSPAIIDRWVVVVYERQQRFNQQSADEMTSGLLTSCRDVGMGHMFIVIY